MKVNIKSSSGGKFEVEIEKLSETVGEFKGRLAELSGIPKESQRLIYRGHVLKDQQTLKELVDDQKLEDGHTMHLVRGAAPASAKSAPSTSATPAAATAPMPGAMPGATPTAAPGAMPGAARGAPAPGAGGLPGFPGLGGAAGGNMFSPENLAELQQNFDPQMLRELMDTPMMRQMMRSFTENPELMRQMILANPQIQQLREQNPEVAHFFNDPNSFRQALEVARNPSLMNEMLRNTDRQMANIEMTPGGFDALRNLYQNVQQPLMDATTRNATTGNTTDTAGSETTQTQGQGDNPFASLFNAPSVQPMPNPWNPSAGGAAPAPGTTAATGATGATPAPGANPLAGLFGAGGMGGGMNPGAAGVDPNSLLQMLEMPGVQEMMQSMLSNPALVEEMAQNNPAMQSLMQQNPQLGTLMRDPNIIRVMTNPEVLRTMIQIQNAAGAAGGMPGMMGGAPAAPGATPAPATTPATTGATGTTGTTGTGATGGAAPNFTGADMQAFTRMLQQMNAGGPAAPPQEQLTPEQAEERFASQLGQLQDMGFFDRQMCVQALTETGGNVSAAVERLLNLMP